MGRQATSQEDLKPIKNRGITALSVDGFKSLDKEHRIEIRPLTLLAGANSSGKSSMLQPLLLLKQTLEAPYDPGVILLNGPNVRFTSLDQVLSCKGNHPLRSTFCIDIQLAGGLRVKTWYIKRERGFAIEHVSIRDDAGEMTVRPEMKHEEIKSVLESRLGELFKAIPEPEFSVVRRRCFLEFVLSSKKQGKTIFGMDLSPMEVFRSQIKNVIHVPGQRGNPERTYATTAVESAFPGTFEKYVASVIAQWQDENKRDLLGSLAEQMGALGLGSVIAAESINDTQVELRVGRLLQRGKGRRDTINIADVGFGTSQTLPVLVALLTASPGQLIYLEQPEIHLHPKAQLAMAQVLVDAARRGVKVVAETHSALILRGVQTAVAEGRISHKSVALYWFTRLAETGYTEISEAELDRTGAYGQFPADFDDVALDADTRYLNAAEQGGIRGDGGSGVKTAGD